VFSFVKLYAAALLTAWQLVLGLVLIVMVFVAPTGIFGCSRKGFRGSPRPTRGGGHDRDRAHRPASTRGLSLRFGGVVAADAIDFDLLPGERLAGRRPERRGKTTFINICTGFLKPDSGQVFFDGTEVTGRNPRQIHASRRRRSFQLPQLFTEHTRARLP